MSTEPVINMGTISRATGTPGVVIGIDLRPCPGCGGPLSFGFTFSFGSDHYFCRGCRIISYLSPEGVRFVIFEMGAT